MACRQIMDILRRFNQTLGVTIVIVTHDRTLTKMVNRVVAIRDGKTSSEILVKENLRERLASITDFEGLETHEEFAVLDRVGRVQIPEDFLSRLELAGNTVKMEYRDGQVTMSKPDRDT
jgi:ABC-type methionine transport system ATPase subunit